MYSRNKDFSSTHFHAYRMAFAPQTQASGKRPNRSHAIELQSRFIVLLQRSHLTERFVVVFIRYTLRHVVKHATENEKYWDFTQRRHPPRGESESEDAPRGPGQQRGQEIRPLLPPLAETHRLPWHFPRVGRAFFPPLSGRGFTEAPATRRLLRVQERVLRSVWRQRVVSRCRGGSAAEESAALAWGGGGRVEEDEWRGMWCVAG